MLNATAVEQALDQLAMLRFFPSDPGTRSEIARLIGKLCATDQQVSWLAGRVIDLYDEWPGPHELRAVMSSKFKPADGIDADSKHPRYIEDGIPSERPQLSAPVVTLIEGEALKPQPKIAETITMIMRIAMATPKPSKEELESSRRFFEERGVMGL